MDKQVRLGQHLLHGTNHFGQWVTEATEGWDEPPTVRDLDEERPSGHGSFDLPSYYAARTPTLDGILFADSRAQAKQALHALNASASLGLQTLIIADADGTQWARVKLAGLDHTWVTSTVVRWQLRLKAPDPRKFGNTQDFTRTNGKVEVFHRGNFDAHPTIVVRGSAANGYRINSADGKQYRVSRALETDKPHRIEFNDGLLRVDGVLVPNGAPRADVWPVPPGRAIEFDINVVSGGSAEATITVTDTFI